MAIRIHTPLIADLSPLKQATPAATDLGLAEQIASALKAVLAPVRQLTQACNLALAKAVGARDYNTARAGSEVRNVMTLDQAIGADILRHTPIDSPDPAHNAFEASGLASLIAGRDFIALTHGEGPDAQVSIIFNDSVNKHLPTALSIWREGRGLEVLMAADLQALARSPQDRIVLGPLKHQARRASADALYHEAQRDHDCAIHAANAMLGGPLLNKADFDKKRIEHRLAHFTADTPSVDDFYRNTPADARLAHLYDLDHGIQGDELAMLLDTLLPGEIHLHRPASDVAAVEPMRQARMLDLAEHATDRAQGCILLQNDHFIAFRKADNAAGWAMIDSTRAEPQAKSPFDFLNESMSDESRNAQYREWLTWEPCNPSASRH